jgi:hypothetical protein
MMKGKQQQRKSAPRRRRTNGSTTARNQTKYHRQFVGFETTFSLGPNSGDAVPIAPGNYNPPGSPPATAYSEFFAQRFSQVWKAWRMLGWRCHLVVLSKQATDTNSMIGAVAFNQSLSPATGPLALLSLLKPTSMLQLCELPNVKMLSVSPANSKTFASFSYYQGRRDINSLPFQFIGDQLPYQYVTGLQIFNETPVAEDTIIIRMYGNLLIEFKDPAFYIPPGMPKIDDQDQDLQQQTLVKRLQRTDLTNSFH